MRCSTGPYCGIRHGSSIDRIFIAGIICTLLFLSNQARTDPGNSTKLLTDSKILNEKANNVTRIHSLAVITSLYREGISFLPRTLDSITSSLYNETWRVTWCLGIDMKNPDTRFVLLKTLSDLKNAKIPTSIVKEGSGSKFTTTSEIVRLQKFNRLSALIFIPTKDSVWATLRYSMGRLANLWHGMLSDDTWVYHLDLDNALHCNFFNETYKKISTEKHIELITFPIVYNGEGVVLKPLPRPGAVDTANFLHVNGIVRNASLVWGEMEDLHSKYKYPDASFIIPAILHAERRHTYSKISSVLGYHNRLKWFHGNSTCPDVEDLSEVRNS